METARRVCTPFHTYDSDRSVRFIPRRPLRHLLRRCPGRTCAEVSCWRRRGWSVTIVLYGPVCRSLFLRLRLQPGAEEPLYRHLPGHQRPHLRACRPEHVLSPRQGYAYFPRGQLAPIELPDSSHTPLGSKTLPKPFTVVLVPLWDLWNTLLLQSPGSDTNQPSGNDTAGPLLPDRFQMEGTVGRSLREQAAQRTSEMVRMFYF